MLYKIRVYELRDAARILGVTPITALEYTHRGRISSRKVGDTYFFTERNLLEYLRRSRKDKYTIPRDVWRRNFENRYGKGSYRILLRMLRNPKISDSRIAERLGADSDRVFQWRRKIGQINKRD